MNNIDHTMIGEIAILANTSKENVARVLFGKSGVPIETQKRIAVAIEVIMQRRNSGTITR